MEIAQQMGEFRRLLTLGDEYSAGTYWPADAGH